MTSIWERAYLRLAVAAGLLVVFHLADDFFRGEVAQQPGGAVGAAVTAGVLGTLYVFGLIWSSQRTAGGYWTVLIIILILGVFGSFLSHALGVGVSPQVEEIASTSGGWGPVLATVSILAGIASISTAILAGYLIARPEARAPSPAG